MVVASRAGPRERGMRRRLTPAARKKLLSQLLDKLGEWSSWEKGKL